MPPAPRRPRRPGHPALPSPLEGSYCGSTSTLKRDAAVRAVARRRPATAAPTARDRRARGRCALTTTWARSRPRRRNSGAGPERAGTEARRGRRPRPRSAAPGRLRRADDADQRRERRVAQRLAAALELARPGSRRRRGAAAKRIDGRVGRERLDEHAPAARRRGPARPASWATSANVRSSARKSGKRSVASASSTTPSVDVGEVVALGHHLRADQHAARRRARRRASTRARRRPTSASRRKTSPPAPQLGLEALGAGAVAGDRDASRTRRSASGTRSRWPQWWQASSAVGAVQDERDVARRALPRLPARAAGQEVRPAAAVEQHDRLARVGERLVRARVQRPRGARACRGPRPAAAARRRRARAGAGARSACTDSGRGVALPADEHGAGLRGAALGHAARVVARVALVLVGRVVLLVDDDQAEAARSGAKTAERGPTHDPRLARAQPRATRRGARPRESLECRTATVSPKRADEARDDLRRQRDLGHEHDHAARRARAPPRRRAGRPRSCPSR